MKSVCFYFHIHQPFRLKRYRFFDIGNDHYYFDDFSDDDIMTRLAENSYMPMCDTLLEMIRNTNGGFKCAFGISGTAMEQIQLYVPELIEKFKALADTGCVEFLSGTYSHSLSSLQDPEEFLRDVKKHDDMIMDQFGQKPATFANTELIYDDDIAMLVAGMGFRNCVTVGAKHILGWKSPNYIYSSETAPNLRLLLTNDKLADDVARNFANPEWPGLSADRRQIYGLGSTAAGSGTGSEPLLPDGRVRILPACQHGHLPVHEGASAVRRRARNSLLDPERGCRETEARRQSVGSVSHFGYRRGTRCVGMEG